MPLLRKFVFYLFAALYLTICPLLILRLLGFIVDPQSHQLVKTGIIYLSTNPPDATVYINDLKANETTPTIIRDLPPDHYIVRVELKGYHPWQNKILVQERKATVLENILLTPKQWPVRTLHGLPFENILPLGDGTTLLAWQDMVIKDLYLLRLNKEPSNESNIESTPSDITFVFPEEFIYRDAQIVRFFTVDKSPFFVIHILDGDKHKYLWVDPRDKQAHIEDISDLLPQEPVNLLWEAGDDKLIYAFFHDSINRINIKAKAIYPNISPLNVPQTKDRNLPQIEGARGIIYDETNSVWLFLTAQKIGLWDKDEAVVQWIFEKGNNIEQAFWANSGSTIIFRDGNQAFLLDTQNLDHLRIEKITDIYKGSSVFYSEKTGRLYYVTPQDRLLSAIQILRHKPMLPKTIADTLRLKEFEP